MTPKKALAALAIVPTVGTLPHAVAPPAVALPVASDLYFSEYVEGSSNNKALELFNDTGAAVDLAPYEVEFFFNGNTSPGLTLDLSGTIADGDVFVVAHSAADGAILSVADQTAGGGWFNGDDAIRLVRDGVTLDVIGEIGFDPGSQWGSGTESTQDNTLRRLPTVTGGDANGADPFDPASEWDGFPSNTFDGLGGYPDVVVGPSVLAIAEIQGPEHTSPVVGMSVETSGIVTAVDFNGFYLQDPVGDGDPTTSEGLFVFTSSAPTTLVGDAATVTGTVSEFQPGGSSTENLTITEIAASTVVVTSSGNSLPAPAVLGAAGSLPPTEVIDDDNFALFDPSTDGIDFYEPFEGMLVRVDDPLAVSARNRFDEVYTVTDDGAFATRINARSGITIAETDFNPERIQIQLDFDFTPGFDPAIDTGDQLDDVIGVVSYSFGNYEVRATQTFGVARAGLSPESLGFVPDTDRLTVASYNVLNLDPKVEDIGLVQDAGDIDDDVGEGRFAAIAEQIVVNLASPDIVALQEVQDNDGAELTAVTDASLTYTTLIDAIVTAGGPTYEYRDLPPVDDADGGQPGGNIRVGFLFNPGRVSVDEDSLERLFDTDLGDGDAFEDARKPLAATFEFRGREVTLVNNHFSSKFGSSPLFGLVQPPLNGSVGKREAQAQVVNDYVDGLLLADPEARVIVLGDLNEFDFETPLAVLKGEPSPVLTLLGASLDDLDHYSFMFDGNAQDLDQTLVSDALAPIAEYDVVHLNVEFQDAASDHDPLVSGFVFPDVCQPELGFGGPGTATLTVCGDPLKTTGNAEGLLAGAPAGTIGLLFYSATSTPVPLLGGTLAAFPFAGYQTLVDSDADGEVTFPVAGSLSKVPLSIFLQVVYVDGAQVPDGAGLSNAVEVLFLGE